MLALLIRSLPCLLAVALLSGCPAGDDSSDGGRVRRDGGARPDGEIPGTDGGGPVVRCGVNGTPCCPGRACEIGLTCGRGDQCCAAPGGAPCRMPGDCCPGFECSAGACVTPAGGRCRGSTDCDMGMACIDGTCSDPPAGCGSMGETCCPGFACEAGFVCMGGTCAACGDEREPCCDGRASCTGSLSCTMGVCEMPLECGDAGQPCCPPDMGCSGGLECMGGTCGMRPDVGGVGEMCAPRSRCDEGAVCDTEMRMCVMTPDDCGTDGMMCCTSGSSPTGTCSGMLNCEAGTCSTCTGPSLTCILGGCCNGTVCRPAPFLPRCCNGAGGRCTNSLDCCGLMQCMDGMCAESRDGSFCLDSSECAEGLTCQTFVCRPEEMCNEVQQACTTAAECCDGYTCQRVVGIEGNACCVGQDGTCAEDFDCCGRMECEGSVCLCRARGQTCSGDNDCCDNDICVTGTCVVNDGCQREGGACAGRADCCGDLLCDPIREMGENVCCARVNDPCDDDDDCCGAQLCVDGQCGCQDVGEPCWAGAGSQECCGAGFCDTDTNTCSTG